MPSKSLRPCNKIGCANLTRDRYCEEHKALANSRTNYTKEQKKEYEKQRPNATQRGYDGKWRSYRLQYLKTNPMCVRCGEPASVVDHIIPHKGNKGLFWTRFNHQALCKRCHDIKTATEDGGLGNPVKH